MTRSFVALCSALLIVVPRLTHGQVQCSTSLISLDLQDIDLVAEINNFISSCTITGCGYSASEGTNLIGTDEPGCTVCSAAGYNFAAGISIDLTVLSTLGITLDPVTSSIVENLFPVEFDISAALTSRFCGLTSVCAILSGWDGLVTPDSSCQKISFGFDLWIPTTCDASQDYNALEVYYGYDYAFMCCNDADDCNDGTNFDVSDTEECEEVGGMVSYMNGLGECWSDIQVDLVTYLVCQSNLTNYKDNCKNDDGSWVTSCAYQLTCNDRFLELLSQFGVCACEAAGDAGYPGDLIAEVMEFLWEQYCGEISLTCGASGSLELLLTTYSVSWGMDLTGLTSGSSSDLVQAMIEGVAAYANVDSSLVDIVIDGESAVVDIMLGEESTADYLKSVVETGDITTSQQWVAAASNLQDTELQTAMTGASFVEGSVNTTSVSELYDTSGISSSGSDWANPDSWFVATLISGDAFVTVLIIMVPIALAGLAYLCVQRRKNQNGIQFC